MFTKLLFLLKLMRLLIVCKTFEGHRQLAFIDRVIEICVFNPCLLKSFSNFNASFYLIYMTFKNTQTKYCPYLLLVFFLSEIEK